MTANTNSKSGVTLCSCGSGREAKHCCGATPKQGGLRWLWPASLFALTAAALVGVLVVDFSGSNIGPRASTGPTPEPWEYNPDTNQHWDPTHGHWHDGPPPAGVAGTEAPPPGETPEPWAYDEDRNQYWDPVHNHWHEGLPPPESQR